MGVRIISAGDLAALYDSTRMTAFGPVFSAEDFGDAEMVAGEFLDWLPEDARHFSTDQLTERVSVWLELRRARLDLDAGEFLEWLRR